MSAAPRLRLGARAVQRASFHLRMPDGVPLAVDVTLPAAAAPVATILHQTRYYRGVAMRPGFGWLPLGRAMDTDYDTRARFVAAGYAWVGVCVRGSGASGGVSPYPWSTEEIADGGRVLDWIVAQPWSSGRVGATGISYAGTSAELLASLGHPALCAIAPRFSCFDVYADVAFPGGLHLSSFTRSWSALNRHLDAGDVGAAVALNLGLSGSGCADLAGPRYRWLRAAAHPWSQALIRGALRGVAAGAAGLDGDPSRRAVRAAVAEHAANEDIHASALRIVHRDDVGFSERLPHATVDAFSPHRFPRPNLPVLSYSGWLDGGYAAAAAKRHGQLGRAAQLVLGPWNHGGQQDVSPFTPSGEARDDHTATLLAFFDRHVRQRPEAAPEPAVRYFTLGEERWKDATTWPPPGTRQRSLYLASDQTLQPTPPEGAGAAPYRVDLSVGTGRRARWDSLLGLKAPTGYGDGDALCGRARCFTSAPLSAALEVTGHPRARLRLSASQTDAALFVYLVDVSPAGRATVVTEGQLRLLHRRVADGEAPYPNGTPRSFLRADAMPLPVGEPVDAWVDLLPTSYRFGEGHALRLAITGADAHHFSALSDEPGEWLLHWGGASPPRVELPTPE